jgi:hypothetical protein
MKLRLPKSWSVIFRATAKSIIVKGKAESVEEAVNWLAEQQDPPSI